MPSIAEPSSPDIRDFLRGEGQSSSIDGLARDILQLRRRLQASEACVEEKDLEIRALHIALRCFHPGIETGGFLIYMQYNSLCYHLEHLVQEPKANS